MLFYYYLAVGCIKLRTNNKGDGGDGVGAERMRQIESGICVGEEKEEGLGRLCSTLQKGESFTLYTLFLL